MPETRFSGTRAVCRTSFAASDYDVTPSPPPISSSRSRVSIRGRCRSRPTTAPPSPLFAARAPKIDSISSCPSSAYAASRRSAPPPVQRLQLRLLHPFYKLLHRGTLQHPLDLPRHSRLQVSTATRRLFTGRTLLGPRTVHFTPLPMMRPLLHPLQVLPGRAHKTLAGFIPYKPGPAKLRIDLIPRHRSRLPCRARYRSHQLDPLLGHALHIVTAHVSAIGHHAAGFLSQTIEDRCHRRQ